MKRCVWGCILFFGICILSACGKDIGQEMKPITEQEIQQIIRNKEDAFIYYGQELCGKCIHMEEMLKQLPKETRLKIRYLDADTVEKTVLLETYQIKYTPTLITIEEGKLTVYDQQYNGEEIGKIFEDADEIVDDRVDDCIEIDDETLTKKMSEKKDFILYIGREDCHTCGIFNPILQKYIEQNEKMGVYYFDMQEMRNKAKAENAEQSDINTYERFVKDYSIEWVPSMLHVRNGIVVSKFEFLDTKYYELEDNEEKRSAEEREEKDFKMWMDMINE